MKIGLVITNDWELFGDGSGDYFEIQHKPTLELINLAESYSAKFTLMAEVMQQFAYLDLSRFENRYSTIPAAWEEILKKTVQAGNDVQLHLHPQWIGASFQNGKWMLNMENWAISQLSKNSIYSELIRGKNYLESLLKTVKQDYQCIAFRAGAYCLQPPKEVISSLKEAGIHCDTSVTNGLVSDGFYDFRKSPSNIIPWYTTADDVKCIGSPSDGIFEMPIYSITGLNSQALKKFLPRLYYLLKFGVSVDNKELIWLDEKEKVKNKRYPKADRFYKKKENKNFLWYLKALVNIDALQLDYDYIPATAFVKILENISNNRDLNKKYNEMILPVIVSGHIKDIHNCNNIERIFDLIDKRLKDRIVYWTLSDAINNWTK